MLDEEELAAGWLIDGLCQGQAHLPPLPLILPRTREAYGASGAFPIPFSFGMLKRLVDTLAALGWVSVAQGSVRAGYTRISPAGALSDYCVSKARSWALRQAPDPAVLLHLTIREGPDAQREFIRDEADPRAAEWRANVNAINHFLADQCIYLRMPDAELVRMSAEAARRTRASKKPYRVHYAHVFMHRVFSGSTALGGRFYGGWWQNVPSGMRRYIWINEWQGIEYDYSGMAIRCLYAREGLPVPADPYDIGLTYAGPKDPRREVVKTYINAILNDREGVYRPGQEDLLAIGLRLRELKDRVWKSHARIAHHFHTDAGMRMQFVDAQIAEQVMLRMMRLGAVCLPIHDSFIVQAPFFRELTRVMEASFRDVTGADARLKAVMPAPVTHYSSNVITAEESEDVERLRARMASEYERMSVANDYFTSWADQMLGEDGWRALLQNLDQIPASLLPYHAMPLRLLRREERGIEGGI